MIDLLTKSVASIIKAIQQAAILSVRSIKSHTFDARITNLPEVQRIRGVVAVDQSKVEKGLSSVKESVDKVETAIKDINIPIIK